MSCRRGARVVVLAVFAAMVTLVSSRAATAQSPTITVEPATVAVGARVSISGMVPTSGRAACDASDAATLTSTAALFPPDGIGPQVTRDTSGAFRTIYSVPVSTPAGSYTIGVRCGGGNVGVGTNLHVIHRTATDSTGGSGGANGWIVAAGVTAGVVVLAFGSLAVRRRSQRGRDTSR
jgi:hypothetical protein